MITKIQRFSLHDGPGIRTTCFLKGCSLRCPWCCNPENISPHIQSYNKDGKEGIYGVYYSLEELYKEISKDRFFYEGEIKDYNISTTADIERLPGGVTFSGGECLTQMEALALLCERLKKENIHIVVETSLFVPQNNLRLAIENVDFFYVDMKILDSKKCQKILHGSLKLYLSNLRILLQSDKPVVVRVPVIGGYTDDMDNRKKVADLIAENKKRILKVELLKEHNLGISKYQSLLAYNKEYKVPNYMGVSDDLMDQYRTEIQNALSSTIPVEVCRI